MSDPWAEVQDWERWAREVLTDWRVPFDNHKVGLRLGITQHLCDIRDERDEYKAGFKEAMTDHAATLERLADCERQRDEPCGFKGDEPTCLVASRLKARLAEEQRDAERYRWLRDDNAYAPEEMGICGRDELDKLCDSAIAKGTRLHCVRCGCRIGYINQLDGQQLCPHCAARYSAQATDNAPAQESK